MEEQKLIRQQKLKSQDNTIELLFLSYNFIYLKLGN